LAPAATNATRRDADEPRQAAVAQVDRQVALSSTLNFGQKLRPEITDKIAEK
jgi:hypothetical protein